MLKRGRMKYIYVFAFVYITSVPILARRFIEFNEEPTDVVVMRNKPAELRCNVTGINNVVISWTKDGVTLDLTNDTRRTILPHGSLYFETIVRKKKFSPDSGVYRCFGETKVNGRSFKIVSQKARLTVVGMSKSFSELPQDLTVSEGETAWFKCELKRSRPAAKITWSKEGKNTDLSLNFRFVVFPSGILEILSVMPSDAGNYICKVTNEELGKYITAKAKLIITPASTAVRPNKFLVEPRNVMALHGTNAILECIVTGYPKPQVDWYKDGKKITLTKSGHYIKYGASSLNISDVKPGDSGKYECVMGTKSAGATLQVVVPPRFKVLPTDVETTEGKDIIISCEATGSPQPKVSWYKNGDSIDGIEHITIEEDSITIMEVLHNDEGIYQCAAKNDGGEIRASAQLDVYDPPTTAPTTTVVTRQKTTPTTAKTTASRPVLAPSAPKNVRAVALNTTAIHVIWQPPDHPHGIIKKYTVVMYGYGTGSLKFESMLTTQKTSLVVTKLKPSTMYKFVVYALNEFKKGALSASVQEYTKTPATSSLGPPRHVHVFSISSVALKVTWKPPIFYSQVIKNYSIKYRDVDHNTGWQTESSLTHYVVLLKLRSYTTYSVKVTAHTQLGPGQTSPEVLAKTKSGKPKGPPQSVRVIATNGVLVASWAPPLEPNGNITGYMMKLKNENTGSISNFTTTRKNKVFKNVEKSTTYGFKVAAVTEAGQGEFSQWVTKDMPSKPRTEDVVPGKPTNLRARVVFGMVQVSWSAPKENHIIVRGYVLSYGKMTPDSNYKDLPNNETSYLIQNLQSGTSYIIRVRAKNKMGHGLEAMEKVTIPRSTQSSAIYSLQALPIKKRTIKLSWVDPTGQTDLGYHVKYEKDSKWIYLNVTERTSALVKHLRAGMLYTFFVKRNDEIDYTTVSNTTKEEAPDPPKDVTVSIDSLASTVNVHWNTPDHTNGKLTNYKICWRPENNHRKKNWTCKMVKAHVLNEQISNINSTLKYSVKILAKNQAGEGEFSETKEFYGDSVISLVKFSITTKAPKVFILSRDKTVDGHNPTTVVTELTTNFKGSSTMANKEKKQESLTSDEKTLWIVIAVIATVTLIAILVISIILCKKRSHDSPIVRRKPPPHPYKAVANGSSKKKKSDKDGYWIKQDEMGLEPCVKKSNDLVECTIPRNADEMKPLDSPFQSRKVRTSLEEDDLEDEQLVEQDQRPPSVADEPPYKHSEDYQPLPINIQTSPFFSVNRDDIPPPGHECPDKSKDDGAATSSDYGSEEIVTAPCDPDEPPAVTYMTKNAPNGCVSVASDYDYLPHKHATDYDIETHALQNLMKDLESIMAKEDRV